MGRVRFLVSRLGGGAIKRGRLRHPRIGLGRAGLVARARGLSRRPRRGRPARRLPHLSGDCERQSRDFADGFLDLGRTRAAREGGDHGVNREEEDHGGSVDGPQLRIDPDQRPGDSADGLQVLQDLVPAAAQHVRIAPGAARWRHARFVALLGGWLRAAWRGRSAALGWGLPNRLCRLRRSLRAYGLGCRAASLGRAPFRSGRGLLGGGGGWRRG